MEAGLLILHNEIKRLGFTPSGKTAKMPYDFLEKEKWNKRRELWRTPEK